MKGSRSMIGAAIATGLLTGSTMAVTAQEAAVIPPVESARGRILPRA